MGDFDRKQLEQLNAIGEYLQHIRQDQGRSLDDISAKTYIPLRILRALEGGQEGILPEAVFVQGFIRRYADALGLDGMSLSRSFPVEREAAGIDSSEQPRREPTQTLAETRISASPRSDYSEQRITPSRRRGQSSFSLPLAIVGLLVAGGLVYALSRLIFAPQRSPQTATNSPASTAPTAPASSPKPPAPGASAAVSSSPASSPAASPSPASSPAARTANPSSATTPATAPANAPVNVAMNVTADAWVQVITDGRVAYEGILTRGTKRNWSAQQEMTIVSGNAGGVTLSQNQSAAKPMGAAGTVEEVTFTANPGNSSTRSSTGNSAAPN